AASDGVTIGAGAEVSISGLSITNFGSNGVRVLGDLTLSDSTVTGGFIGIWVDGGSLDLSTAIIAGPALFGVQVNSGGEATISDSEVYGSGATAGVIVSDGQADIVGSIITGSSRGILVNATGAATVHGSDLSGTSVRAIENATGAIVDASGNWWGSNVAATVAAQSLGLVDFTPYLHDGADLNGGDRGFEADASHVHVTKLGQQ